MIHTSQNCPIYLSENGRWSNSMSLSCDCQQAILLDSYKEIKGTAPMNYYLDEDEKKFEDFIQDQLKEFDENFPPATLEGISPQIRIEKHKIIRDFLRSALQKYQEKLYKELLSKIQEGRDNQFETSTILDTLEARLKIPLIP